MKINKIWKYYLPSFSPITVIGDKPFKRSFFWNFIMESYKISSSNNFYTSKIMWILEWRNTVKFIYKMYEQKLYTVIAFKN